MIKKLYPNDEELLDKFYNLHEQSQLNKSIFKSTSHICNASIKKITNQSLNDSKHLYNKRKNFFRLSKNDQLYVLQN